MDRTEEIKKCPFCAEDIKRDAIKCKHCGELLIKEKSPEIIQKGKIRCPFCQSIIMPQPKQSSVSTLFITIILLCFFIIPGIIYVIWESSRKQCPKCNMALS